MALDLWAPIVSRLELLASDHHFKRLAKIRDRIVSRKCSALFRSIEKILPQRSLETTPRE